MTGEPLALHPRVCPDCPASHAGVMPELLPRAGHACAFRVLTVAAREALPHAWFGQYAMGLVRRGVVVRQRIDAQGQATAIDVVGPGSALLLDAAAENASGYAASDTMVCLCPAERMEGALRASLPTARDMLRLHAAAIERIERLADARNRPTARARVAALLATLADVLSPPRRLEVIPPDLQRRDLAALVALRHESVCRELARLERARLVRRTSEGIVLLDRAALDG